MANITLQQPVKITNGLTEVVEKHYIIPDQIICKEDKNQMTYNPYYGGYVCNCESCKNFVSVADYVAGELRTASLKEKYGKKMGVPGVPTQPPILKQE